MDEVRKPLKLLLRNGRAILSTAATPQACDIGISDDGLIARIAPRIEPEPTTMIADLAGQLVVPGLVDAHQHLDKTRSRDLMSNSDGTLEGAVLAFKRYATTVSIENIIARAEATIDACIARGTTAIRTHVNVGPEPGLRGLEALAEVRKRTAERIRLQIVALVPPDIDLVRKWISEAAAVGIDAIGGTPAHADDPNAYLIAIFDEAERHGIDVDLHLDEHLKLAGHLFNQLAEVTTARGMQGHVVAGHCAALGAIPSSEAELICDLLASAEIGVVTLPSANLYLLGRDFNALIPRGITRVHSLCRAGVNIACGSDNIQDAFVPTGTGDLLEVSRWTMLAAHFNDFESAFRMVTAAPSRMMHFADQDIRIGARADLLITSAYDLADLVASGPLDRMVLYGGRLVAGSLPHPASKM